MYKQQRNQFYKNKYYIAFYDKDGEHFVHMFDNIIQILEYKGIEVNLYNVKLYRIELCKSLKTPSHYTKMLDGTLMTVWLIDKDDSN